jgi:hypothetical protein
MLDFVVVLVVFLSMQGKICTVEREKRKKIKKISKLDEEERLMKKKMTENTQIFCLKCRIYNVILS